MQSRFLGVMAGVVAGLVLGAVGYSYWSYASPTPPDGKSTIARHLHPPAAEAESPPAPTLSLDSSGQFTGHFDRVSRTWLLQALARAGVFANGSPVVTPTAPQAGVESDIATDVATDVADAMRTLRTGSEPEQLVALTRLVQSGVDVPARELIDTFQRSASDRLALLAFGTYVDSVAVDPDSARSALDLGQGSANEAVRADATRRKAEFERLARTQEDIAAQGLQ